jgi:hypothetical protein
MRVTHLSLRTCLFAIVYVGAPGSIAAGQDAKLSDASEIVVTGKRRNDDVVPVRHLTAQDIRALGVTSIGDLVRRLGAQAKGADGAAPVFALNGRRPLDDEEVQSLPLDAIETLDILPAEAAARIGYPPTQPVMNLATKAHYRGFEAQTENLRTTEGGGGMNGGKAIVTRIRDKRRLTLTASFSAQSELRQDRRSIAPDASVPFDAIGNITGIDGGEIDPRLSTLAGRPVTIAAVPVRPDARGSLSNYLATAGQPSITDVGPFRSLQGRQRTLKLSSFYSQPIATDVTGAFSLSFQSQRSRALQGLGNASVIVPPDASVLPFDTDVLVNRYLVDAGPLIQTASTQSFHAAAGLTGNVQRWNWTLRLIHDHKRNVTRSDLGYDISPVQAAVATGRDPFSPLSLEDFGPRIVDNTRSTLSETQAQLQLDGSPATLPAGPMLVAATIRGQQTHIKNRSSLFPETDASFSRRLGGGEVNITIPIASYRENVLPFLGSLTAELSGGVTAVSRFNPLYTSRYGIIWTPLRGVQLLVSVRHADATPPLDQQAASSVTTPNVPFFDLVKGENVLVTATSGGNLDLLPERRRTLSMTANLQPLKDSPLTLSMSYAQARINDPTIVLSTLNPAVELAFPDRFRRNELGRLTSVDFRATNVARELQETLKGTVSYAGPVGSKPVEGKEEATVQRPNLTASLTSTLRIANRLLLTPGAPELDLLHGDSISATGGRPRWQMDADVGLFHRGLGFLVQSSWRSGSRFRSEEPSADLRFKPLGTANVSLFADLETAFPKVSWASKATVELSVRNIGNARPQVVDRRGVTPNGLQAAYLDPLGRSVSLNLLKRF